MGVTVSNLAQGSNGCLLGRKSIVDQKFGRSRHF